MQLACPLSQQLDLLGIDTANQFLEKNTGRRGFILKIAFPLQHALVVATESVDGATPHNGIEQLRTKGPVPNSVAQDGAILSSEVRYDRLRRVLRNRLRGFTLCDLYRYGVPFRGSIQIIYVDEPESGAISIN